MTSPSNPNHPPHDPLLKPDPLHTSILGLRQQLEHVVTESAAYRHEVEDFKRAQIEKDAKRDRARKRENSIAVLVAIAICIPILIMLGLLLQNLGIARDARTSAAEAKRTASTIEDCIIPTGQCYQDASKRTGGAVANIVKINLAIAICQETTSTVEALRACVDTRLRQLGVSVPPTSP
jgi:hypothetical protein